LRLSPDTLGSERFSHYSRASIFLCINKNAVTRQKEILKELLQRKNIPWTVNRFIQKLNEQIRGFSNYFNLTKQTGIQMKALSNYIYLRFKKLLYGKFHSKPKTRTFVRQSFLKRGTIVYNNKNILLKYEGVRPFGMRGVNFISETENHYEHNIYLNKEKFTGKKNLELNALSLYYNSKPLNRSEFEALFARKQGYICNICKNSVIPNFDILELDHKPSLYLIKKISITNILNEISSNLYKKRFNQVNNILQISHIERELKQYDFKNYFDKNILNKIKLFLVHKECNRGLGKIASKNYNKTRTTFKKVYKKTPEFINTVLDSLKILDNFLNETYKFNKNKRSIFLKIK
jgi:hypothetical protein